VKLVQLTHAAGLSATGDAALDHALPLPERYEIPQATADAVEQAWRERRRVLAVGTTVVRALESSVREHGRVRAGQGLARLVVTRDTPLLRANGILSGAHAPEESHYRLLSAFADPETLARATAHSEAHGYRLHEQGDAWLVLPSELPARQRLAAGAPAY
jgi:S-adenosylmethionine:tRNA ribosyltransferase-isomerase